MKRPKIADMTPLSLAGFDSCSSTGGQSERWRSSSTSPCQSGLLLGYSSELS